MPNLRFIEVHHRARNPRVERTDDLTSHLGSVDVLGKERILIDRTAFEQGCADSKSDHATPVTMAPLNQSLQF